MSVRPARILVVDDEPNIRKMLAGVLGDEGYSCTGASDLSRAREEIGAGAVDLVLLDVCLPGEDGMELLRQKEGLPPVIMMSGHGDIQTAMEAIRLGAYDFIEKPIAVERLLLSMQNCLDHRQLSEENVYLQEQVKSELLGESRVMQDLRAQIARAAPTEARVLITGENGTGKELVARALHTGSPRSKRPLIKVNCAAIPSELLESELFGHEKGAFTGAIATRRGKFELAQNGTLLLDEIGDMNPTTQAKLLRVLEENELERVGGERTIPLDVRVLASTNRELAALLERGDFREDLYFRLKVIPIRVPALRDHAADIGGLAEHYLEHFCAENGRKSLSLSAAAQRRLESHAWPGNVRELKNLCERMTIMVDGEQVEPSHLEPLLGEAETQAEDDTTLAAAIEATERRLIREAVAASDENIAEAARRLGLDRANLHRKMKRLGLLP